EAPEEGQGEEVGAEGSGATQAAARGHGKENGEADPRAGAKEEAAQGPDREGQAREPGRGQPGAGTEQVGAGAAADPGDEGPRQVDPGVQAMRGADGFGRSVRPGREAGRAT